MTTRAELWQALVSYRVPYVGHVISGRKKVRGSNDDVGNAYRIGRLEISKPEECFVQTANGNFTCAMVFPEEGPFPSLVVWWSYTTPIAVFAPGAGLAFVSTYSYSITTSNKHMSRVCFPAYIEQLRYDGHIGDGTLKADSMVQDAKEEYEKAVEDILRRRKPTTWHAAVNGSAENMLELSNKFSMPHNAVAPMEYLRRTNDKAFAKMVGWQFRNPGLAHDMSLVADRIQDND